MDNLDSIYGVLPHEFASLEDSVQSDLGSAEEIAVVGLWSFNEELNCHKCDRFFYVPYPQTRDIKKSDLNTLQ